MNKSYKIVIAGAGGIAEAAGLLLSEWSEVTPEIFIGDRQQDKAYSVANWISSGTSRDSKVTGFHLPEEGITDEVKRILENGDILLDCLPGSIAPRIASFAKDYRLHYANLTEYVAETNEIKELARNADTGFILQTGLAPGYIVVLANGLFQKFCEEYKVEMVNKVEFKVGALTDHAIAPHYYGFTWSPIGVATEYMKDTAVIRNFKRTTLPALSELKKIIIDGIAYEDNLTSGGAADLPQALESKVKQLDYKTLRHPGHYGWVKEQISKMTGESDRIKVLEKKMLEEIPHVEDDQIILYAAVEGKDHKGILRRKEISKKIKPLVVGSRKLRAIQTTTASALIQCAQMLLENNSSGVILQSQIDAKQFLNGNFITKVYGNF